MEVNDVNKVLELLNIASGKYKYGASQRVATINSAISEQVFVDVYREGRRVESIPYSDFLKYILTQQKTPSH